MQKLFTLGLIAILVIGLITAVPLTHTFAKTSKDKKARDAIVKAMGRAVEGKYSTIDMVNISKKSDNSTIVIYNKTVVVVPPTPPTPPEPPQPVPTGDVIKVCLVGDLKGNAVPNLMKENVCNLKIALGDLGYASDLAYYKGLKFDRCVPGNHDTEEDGSAKLEKEALALCGNTWWMTIANGTALLIGLNTNGESGPQIQTVKSLIEQNSHLKTVVLVSHKGGHVSPNSHHPAEAKALYQQLEQLVPSSIKLIEVVGHNHVMTGAPSENWYESGAGGKSHYTCGTNAVWTICDEKNWGYLELTIDAKTGATAAKFIK